MILGFIFSFGIVCSPGSLFLAPIFGTIKISVMSRPLMRDSWKMILLHPGLLLPTVIFIVGLFANHSTYQLWSFDDYSSWGIWAKQIFISSFLIQRTFTFKADRT
jgi:hypothetical protein